MMAGEIEYENFIYENGDAIFPFTGHFMILLFVVLISIILMNLLVGLAVSDIQVSIQFVPQFCIWCDTSFLLGVTKKCWVGQISEASRVDISYWVNAFYQTPPVPASEVLRCAPPGSNWENICSCLSKPSVCYDTHFTYSLFTYLSIVPNISQSDSVTTQSTFSSADHIYVIMPSELFICLEILTFTFFAECACSAPRL